MLPRRRIGLAVAAVGLACLGLWLSWGPPRLTVLNTGLLLSYPVPRAAGALLAGAGAALCGWALRHRGARVAAALLVMAALGLAARLSLYRIEVDASSLRVADLFRNGEIAWQRVSRVDRAAEALLVFVEGQPALRVDLWSCTPDQRASLERGIARRVREAASRQAAPRPGETRLR